MRKNQTCWNYNVIIRKKTPPGIKYTCVFVFELTSLDSMIPKTGNKMVGSSAVTASGRTSVHQYTAMRVMT